MELKITYDTKELDSLAKQFPEATREAAEDKITNVLMLLERVVKERTPVGASQIHLKDTIFGQVISYGEKVTGLLGTPLEYGTPVEFGTKAHFPPIDPIEKWVKTKLEIDGKEARTVAFLICRAISKHGTKGAQMFTSTFDDYKGTIMRILNEIPQEILRKIRS